MAPRPSSATLPLQRLLEAHFGGARPGGSRFAALGSTHALHESGYEVRYSRYAVTYRDAQRDLALGAEIDDEGVLLIHARATIPADVLSRVDAALQFLGVRFTHT